jgi:hypothetical protein
MPALNLGNKLLGSKIRQFFLRDKRQLLVDGNEKHQNGVALENRKAERTPMPTPRLEGVRGLFLW